MKIKNTGTIYKMKKYMRITSQNVEKLLQNLLYRCQSSKVVQTVEWHDNWIMTRILFLHNTANHTIHLMQCKSPVILFRAFPIAIPRRSWSEALKKRRGRQKKNKRRKKELISPRVRLDESYAGQFLAGWASLSPATLKCQSTSRRQYHVWLREVSHADDEYCIRLLCQGLQQAPRKDQKRNPIIFSAFAARYEIGCLLSH